MEPTERVTIGRRAEVTRLGLGTVPTLFLVTSQGRIDAVAKAFRRADLEAFAARLQVPPPLFLAGDDAPALRPG